MNPLLYEEIVKKALVEDIGFQDITTDAIVTSSHFSTAEITAKQAGILAGIDIAATAFRLVDSEVIFSTLIHDGDNVYPGQVIARVRGRTRSLLSAERTALNFMQRLSGIATAARQALDAVKDFNCQIVDTRKTTPGLRSLEKYAVRVGGGHNHRFGLFDAVLIKDNHIEAAGSISKAVDLVRERIGHMVKIEVETESLEQVKEALAMKVDAIMLDNMSLELMTEAVRLIDGRSVTEASGGINLESLALVAATGVNLISLGWLTHSAPSLDLSLNIVD